MKTILLNQFVVLFVLFPIYGKSQYVTVSGYVTHFLTGKAIENASVFEKSTGIGTISDGKGYFQLVLAPGNVNIIFDEEGFRPFNKQFTVKSDTTLFVQLKPEKWLKNQEKLSLKTKPDEKEKQPEMRRRFLFF